MVRDTDNLHFTVGLLCRFSTGSNTYVGAQVAISGLFADLRTYAMQKTPMNVRAIICTRPKLCIGC